MGKKPKANKLQQIQNASQIPESRIPLNAAQIQTLGIYASDANYRLIFKYYNHSQCEILSLSKARMMIEKFNHITQWTFKNISGVRPVYNSGDYKTLFSSNIPSDVDKLEEINISGPERIIFFRIRNYFCIVAILANHRRT